MENVSTVPLTDDQHFLLHLITGTYFAPDLKDEIPRKSPLQRRAERLPQYGPNALSGSRMKTAMMECVYYYVLRKAQPSVLVKQSCFLRYIHGGRPVSIDKSLKYPSFDDLFPPGLHARSHDTIDNVVFINNPYTDYLKARDVERFRRLTGLDDFLFDRENAMLHIFEDLYDIKVHEASNSTITCNNGHPSSEMTTAATSFVEDLDQGMIFVPSRPSVEEWGDMIGAVKFGFAVTGSAARGHVGPVLGLMDIGEAEDSYLFRVSLPGVKRDERDFNCEVESDGTVIINGVTVTGERIVGDFNCEVESDGTVIINGVTVTGERIVVKSSQAFEMKSHNLSPPGPFSISFKLPGRVDPQRFHGTFATDGILEGIAFKASAS
ncbi:hypothetical protein PHJA_000139800 [Phtheirospermum japonicum]|uniref:SHSP domain-containing protein n=1 Tax=Phtheirospermum japonicum TaxID=374723 RepID=A0A830B5U1_9LAMI|nr:hypothetical protein PHJA_000139800 [Phtheirospermum japonicum]